MNNQTNKQSQFVWDFFPGKTFHFSTLTYNVEEQTTNIEMVLSIWIVVLGYGNS